MGPFYTVMEGSEGGLRWLLTACVGVWLMKCWWRWLGCLICVVSCSTVLQRQRAAIQQCGIDSRRTKINVWLLRRGTGRSRVDDVMQPVNVRWRCTLIRGVITGDWLPAATAQCADAGGALFSRDWIWDRTAGPHTTPAVLPWET